ncbi:uncharacterized protein LOC18425470 isoform X2 [Amborella trichopoda]|uniref:uncharacterized protein LOC18425470 isoform X2 n=1 Tax=Amborella trichopoda TaxID=13333 RepID=UPI0009BDB3B9|nr:uncharacterized protein LOC18425470 isoform X2 [Amborella trichopoda]|eukprot:XP_020517679.1 uncharacterized protein LOC18425470 isoform X2 [Amborella trichopoda]
MGSLEESEAQSLRRNDAGAPLIKRGSLSRYSELSHLRNSDEKLHLKLVYRLSRFLWCGKIDYGQLICIILAFLFVVALFQSFLPGSIGLERPRIHMGFDHRELPWEFQYLKEMEGLNFGEGVKFVPLKVLQKFTKEENDANMSVDSMRPRIRTPIRRPQLAMVFGDPLMDATQLMMISITLSLYSMGYAIQVYFLEDGHIHAAWKNMGLNVTILQTSSESRVVVDWLNLMQEPFKSVPVIWTIQERALAIRLSEYTSNGHMKLFNDWKQAFERATVVVFSDYDLPMMYSPLDSGNYFVIPGSPLEPWEAYKFMALCKGHDLRAKMGYRPEDVVIAVVGSPFHYNGSWLEHALVMQAIAPLLSDFNNDATSGSHLKVSIICRNSTSTYDVALQAIALRFGYHQDNVQRISSDGDVTSFLDIADIVIYGSFHEEQSFPAILIRAMSLGKPIIAPNISVIRKRVENRVNGFLFPKENIRVITQILRQALSNGKLSPLAKNVGSIGKGNARNLMASDAVKGYADLLQNVLKLSSEVMLPKTISEIPQNLEEWQWNLVEDMESLIYWNKSTNGSDFLYHIEELYYRDVVEGSNNTSKVIDQVFSLTDWEEEKSIEMVNAKRRREEEQLKDRTDQTRGTWEEVYRSAKRADRTKNELHERDDRELERTGQLLCIYEPYYGEGTWPFLHNKSLYRGIGLSTKGRRPGADDIDAPSRLPILSSPYYRDVLREYGAFFAIANRIDRIHKNPWIGFQSWRLTVRKSSLSAIAEGALVGAIEAHRYGDALFFWARMDEDPRNPLQLDFWSFCDSINAGNCRFAFKEAFRRIYGLQEDWNSLPPMPADGYSWSVMHSWALPTRSFLELVMFSRMFVDALDARLYDQHRRTGECYLSLSKDRHCYSRVMELLVNVWAYHSARRIVYISPQTGAMHEHHRLKGRRGGHMWVKWFSYPLLKSMDEDLAEESDFDNQLDRRWLWPQTGEVYWQGVYERERNHRQKEKAERKRRSKDKQRRIRGRTHQRTLGKYIKPPPEDRDFLMANATLVASG